MKRSIFAVALCVFTSVLSFGDAHAEDAKKDAVDTFFAKAGRGSKKIRSFTGKLESPEPAIFPVKKGYCYVLVLRLRAGATMNSKSVGMDWPNDDGDQSPSSFGAEVESATGAAYKPDCAVVNASVGVWTGSMDWGAIKPAGSGGFTIDVYERKGTPKELAAEASSRKQSHADSLAERDALRAKTCSQCASPVSGRKVCVERNGLTMQDCGF